MAINIIGIDCATEPTKVGLARGVRDNNLLTIEQVIKPRKGEIVADIVNDWLLVDMPTLLAIDAPLGWPCALGGELMAHMAGQLIHTKPNKLFRRETDRCVKQYVGKQPLDVGADRIARTARAALSVLQELRERTGLSIPMAWDNHLMNELSAIEVYPAATLSIYGIRSTGYKKSESIDERREIIKGLEQFVSFNIDKNILERDDDVLDGVVCVLAGADFLTGHAYQPRDMDVAKKEGWIWVRHSSPE